MIFKQGLSLPSRPPKGGRMRPLRDGRGGTRSALFLSCRFTAKIHVSSWNT